MFDIDYRVVLYIALVLGCLGTLVLSANRMRNGFLLFICTLGLGWRTFHVTKELRIHPAEVVLWTLFACCLGQLHPRRSGKADGNLPAWLWALAPFWLLAWLPSSENPYSWDVQLSEFRNFLLLIPLFNVTAVVLAKRENWRAIVLTIYCASLWIAVMGLVEYLFPGIADVLPGFVSNPSAMIAADGFARARFAFYGSPVAVYVCILALPMTILLWRWWPAAWPRAITLVTTVLQLAAIYIAGNRAIWLLSAVLVLLFAMQRKRYISVAMMLLLALVGHQTLPETAQSRLHSLSLILEGQPIDSSGVKRWERAMTALGEVWQWPLGRGWAAAGWVHCDFIQVAANLGIVAGLIFAGAYGYTLGRLWLRVRSQDMTEEVAAMGLALFLSFCAVGVILACEPVVVLPQTVLPVWLVWALAEIWLRQTSASPRTTADGKRRASTIFKHRRYRARHGDVVVLRKG